MRRTVPSGTAGVLSAEARYAVDRYNLSAHANGGVFGPDQQIVRERDDAQEGVEKVAARRATVLGLAGGRAS